MSEFLINKMNPELLPLGGAMWGKYTVASQERGGKEESLVCCHTEAQFKFNTAASCICQDCGKYMRDWRSSRDWKIWEGAVDGQADSHRSDLTFYFIPNVLAGDFSVIPTQQSCAGPLHTECRVSQSRRTTTSVQFECCGVFFNLTLETHWTRVQSKTKAATTGPDTIKAQRDTVLLLLLKTCISWK